MVTLGKSSKISRGMVSLRRRRPFQLMVLRRLRELKKIVPVGARRKAKVDVLLRQTAECICMLELKNILEKYMQPHPLGKKLPPPKKCCV